MSASHSWSWLLRLCGCMVAVAVVAFVGAGRAAGVAVPLDVAWVEDMLVDEPHGNVVVTSGGRSSAIAILNLDGSTKRLIEGTVGAGQIELASDGSRAFVAIREQRSIGVLDLQTLSLAKVPVGGACPDSLAQVGGVVWFTYSSCSSWIPGGKLGSLRLSDGRVTLDLAEWPYDRLGGSAHMPERLLAHGSFGLDLLDVSGGPTQSPARLMRLRTSSNFVFAVTPDGGRLVTNTGGLISTTDLSTVGQFNGGGLPAVRHDGLVALTTDSRTVSFFNQNAANPWRRWHIGEAFLGIPALGFGERDVYLILRHLTNGGYFFQRVTPRRASAVSVTTSAATYLYGTKAVVTAKLTGGATNRSLNLYAQPYGRARVLIASGTVDDMGILAVTTPVFRRTTYTAVYSGDDDFDGSSASRMVAGRARVTLNVTKVVGTQSQFKLIRAGSGARLSGLVLPAFPGRCAVVRIIDVDTRRKWASGCIKMDARGRVTVGIGSSVPAGTRIRARLEWGNWYLSLKNASPWLYVKVVR